MVFKLKNIGVVVAGSLILTASNIALADSTVDIVNALISKGVLTEEEGSLLTKGRTNEVEVQKSKDKTLWSNNLKIRGYIQARNTTMLGGDKGVNLFSDRSVGSDTSRGGADKNFLIRRARIVFSGDIGDHLGLYIQPDFASSAGDTGNIAQLRDAYGDLYFDKTKVHRIRVGQSKVPYGFENLQSSQNRLALDRNDALNSAVKDERDTGAFYYYTPQPIQELFAEIGKKGLKHTGNYGMLALGAYNGQGANRGDQNDNYHVVARATYPWKTETGQIYEVGVQGYHGKYVASPTTYRRQTGANTFATATPTIAATDALGIKDERGAISFMMYPQPFGLQAEWTWGNTPGLDVASNKIEAKSLNGGYVQAMYKVDDWNNWGTFIPFVKWQYFDGYNKAESNSAKNNVNDWETGVEWQIAPEVELVAYYHQMKRSNLVKGATGNNADYTDFKASALRVQLQYNF